jgi:hypothetical protein
MAMSLTPTVAALATAETESLRELPLPFWAYGAIAFASFMFLLVVLWSFRNTAAKYDRPTVPIHGSSSSHSEHRGTDRGAQH